ncbi:hypothetical protein ACKKBF_B36925 [Auxenochlorella protothecoides x Auxenochlorella symbiontica]
MAPTEPPYPVSPLTDLGHPDNSFELDKTFKVSMDAETSGSWRDEAPLLTPRMSSASGPRLPPAPSRSVLSHENDKLFDPDACRHELAKMTELAWPIVCSGFLSYGLSVISIAFVGRLGKLELSITLLATSFFNVTGMAIVLGFAGVLETVCGQAYGAAHYRAVGLALQRAVLMALVLCSAITAGWFHAAPLMTMLGQEPAIAAGAARFLWLSSPALFAGALYGVLTRYLLAQGQSRLPTWSAAIAVLLAPVYNYLLVLRAGWGLDGAALALDLTEATLLVSLAWLTWRFNRGLEGTPKQTWHGWSSAALRGWGSYVRIGLPSVAMVLVEWSAFEVCVLEAGWLPDPEVTLAVMGVCLNISTLLYMLPAGLSAACSTRVGNALGAGLGRAAARAACTGVLLTSLLQLFLIAVLVFGRFGIVQILTNVPEVISLAADTLLIVACAILGDGINCTLNGMLRGCGRQTLGAVLNVASFWGVALPLGWALGFRLNWGVRGLWWGLVTGNYLLTASLLVVLATTDWGHQVRRASTLTEGLEAGPPAEDERNVLVL